MKCTEILKEPIILDREDWSKEQWATIVEVFCGDKYKPEDVEAIHPSINAVSSYIDLTGKTFDVTYDITRVLCNGELDMSSWSCTIKGYETVEKLKEHSFEDIEAVIAKKGILRGKVQVTATIEVDGEYYDSDEFVAKVEHGRIVSIHCL